MTGSTWKGSNYDHLTDSSGSSTTVYYPIQNPVYASSIDSMAYGKSVGYLRRSLSGGSSYAPTTNSNYLQCYGSRSVHCANFTVRKLAEFSTRGLVSTWYGNIQKDATRMHTALQDQSINYYYAIRTPVYNKNVDSQMYGACAGILRRGWVGSTFITGDVQPGSRAINCTRFGSYVLDGIHAAK